MKKFILLTIFSFNIYSYSFDFLPEKNEKILIKSVSLFENKVVYVVNYDDFIERNKWMFEYWKPYSDKLLLEYSKDHNIIHIKSKNDLMTILDALDVILDEIIQEKIH